jgi:hypothetical protein
MEYLQPLSMLVLAAAVGLLSWRVRSLSGKLQLAEQRVPATIAQLESLRGELGNFGQTSISMGKRILGQERKLKELVERQQRLELADHGERPYAHAIRMIHQGSGVDEVVANCELTASEAQLLVLMHQMNHGVQPNPSH